MMDETALQALVVGWVVKKQPSSAPQRLTDEDCHQLAEAAQRRFLREHGREAGEGPDLSQLTDGWLVQLERGERPRWLGEDDFRRITDCLKFELPADSDVVEQDPEQERAETISIKAEGQPPEAWRTQFMPAEGEYENSVLADGRLVKDVLKEDPFYFARQHLALSL